MAFGMPWRLAREALPGHAGRRPDAATPFTDTRFPTLPFYDGTPWFLPAVSLYYGLRDRFGR